MNRQSIKVRFLSTFVANILRAGFSFVAGVIIAKALGPGEYGNFSFLLGSFTALAVFVDMSSSAAFYTLVSKGQRGRKFFGFYALWLLVQFVVLLVLVLCLPTSLREKIWFEHPLNLILLALFASIAMKQVWGVLGQIGESIRDTVGVQVRNLVISVVYLVCVLFLVQHHVVSIENLFVLNVILYYLFSALYACRIYRAGVLSNRGREDFKPVFEEFKSFCLPLVVCGCAGVLYSFADYWLLQNFGGSVQQGYYAIGERFAAISLIATASMLQVFWKEIAEASSLGNMERVRLLYRQVSRTLYFVGAIISCVLIPFSREILALFLGHAYESAWLPLSLMFLYPIHQSIGQITGTMFLAMGKTKMAGHIALVFMGISILTAYVVLAPKTASFPGFEMGAMGLALKMIACGILSANISAFFVAKSINAAFDWRHQIYVLILLLPIGFLSKVVAQQVLALISVGGYPIVVMATAATVYLLFVAALVRYCPAISGLTPEQINRGFFWLRARISRPDIALR